MKKHLLRVNLSNRSCREEEIPIQILEKYIGGKGLAAHYLYKELKAATDPLSPENKVGRIRHPYLEGKKNKVPPKIHGFALATCARFDAP